jgi:hypothetical protein
LRIGLLNYEEVDVGRSNVDKDGENNLHVPPDLAEPLAEVLFNRVGKVVVLNACLTNCDCCVVADQEIDQIDNYD